ncbi:hypothetical protein SSX86_031457 [Deinandra increscens subsp. villosa]|uniref:Protein kinase domain-containing protein n=1 Tax=Deinandra increscens subsp. villosa TaxID=3103831 RepID=A0AAP0GI75_9ASTR
MKRYRIIGKLGRGTFGVVLKAFNRQTGEIVAIKKLSGSSDPDFDDLEREVKSLIVNNHENIVTLIDIVLEKNMRFLVFEYMQGSLHDRIVERADQARPFTESEVKDMCFQLFHGLACMHENGFIHRDLKPSNILVYRDTVKISDLGSSREIDDEFPYTHYVGTRCYRAPEVFLRSEVYDSKVDMWAMGAIMYKLFTFHSLFNGSSDLRVMHKICSVLGTPTQSSWPDGLELAREISYRFPEFEGVWLSELLPSASSEAVDLIGSLLSWDPRARPTAMEALRHPFFHGCHRALARGTRQCLKDSDSSKLFKLAYERLRKK